MAVGINGKGSEPPRGDISGLGLNIDREWRRLSVSKRAKGRRRCLTITKFLYRRNGKPVTTPIPILGR